MSPRIDCSIVPDQKRGERIRTMQTFQKIEDHFTGPEVEIAGRLVGQQHLRFIDERARNGDPLAFAGRELVGKLAQTRLEAQFDEKRAGSLFAIARMAAGAEHGDLHIFERVERRQQVERLKNEARRARAVGVEVDRRDAPVSRSAGFADLLPAKQHRAFGWGVESAEQMQQRGFAAAARARDGQEISRRDAETHAAQCFDGAILVALLDIADFEDPWRCRRGSGSGGWATHGAAPRRG